MDDLRVYLDETVWGNLREHVMFYIRNNYVKCARSMSLNYSVFTYHKYHYFV